MDNNLNQKTFRALGVISTNNKAFLFYNLFFNDGTSLKIDQSLNGTDFSRYHEDVQIITGGKGGENSEKLKDFYVSIFENRYFLTYRLLGEKQQSLYLASSSDMLTWNRIDKVARIREPGMVIPNFKHNDKYAIIFGKKALKIAFSADLKTWNIAKQPILNPRNDFFDNFDFKVAGIFVINEGILLVYYSYDSKVKNPSYAVGAVLLEKTNPQKVLWRSFEPIWEQNEHFKEKLITPLGVVDLNGKIIFYWGTEKGIYVVSYLFFKKALLDLHTGKSVFSLEKIKENPILEPNPNRPWESKATFNPAALYEKGKVHIVYRAVGDNDTSVLGYATSTDGINIDERHPLPIYTPTEPFECPPAGRPTFSNRYISGGGYGGCEDPRITKIGDRIFMTYVAFDGCNPPRVALTSIKVDDFNNKRWHWEKPVLISKPGVVDKNACLLSEKINGKYVIFHRIYPDILIDFVSDLDFDGTTKWLKGEFKISPRKNFWDSRKVGAGAPPIKTKKGWLLIYQAVGNQDASKYKMGAMLLNLNDPTKVLHRSKKPILEPNQKYENEGWKYGVAYPCGAVTLGSNLYVYYGGADKVICAAKADLNEFIHNLTHSETPKLEPVSIQQIYN